MYTRAALIVLVVIVSASRLEAQTQVTPPGAVIGTAIPATQSGPASNAAPDAAPADGRLVVPANTTIPLELRNTVSSRTAHPGQAIYCTTIYPITVKNRIIIPVGSYVKGQVTEVTRPGRVKGRAELGVRFDEITLPNGVTKALPRATLSGFGSKGNEEFSPKEGKIEGESTKAKDAEVVAITAAEGAGIGSVAGISSRRSGTGAGIGGAGGALGGLVYVLASRGKDVVLAQGTNLELSLAFPLSYEPDEIESPSSESGPDLGRRDPGPGI